MFSFLVACVLLAATSQQPETLSLLEEPLYAPSVPRAERERLESEIAQARADISRDPSSVDAALRLARAQRGLGHIGDALETLTRAIPATTDKARLRLERGRGFITIRKFELAQREFGTAAETLPEARCDAAFALYLLGQYHQSRDAYDQCADPGMFGYLAARRSGVAAGPRPTVTADAGRPATPIKLPGSVVSKPERDSASMATVYMDAVDRLIADDRSGAKDLLTTIIKKQKTLWMDPLYVAAEADYTRIVNAEPRKRRKKLEP